MENLRRQQSGGPTRWNRSEMLGSSPDRPRFRPGCGCHDAIKENYNLCADCGAKRVWELDADLATAVGKPAMIGARQLARSGTGVDIGRPYRWGAGVLLAQGADRAM